ncbi:MAG: HAD family hydrolase [Bacteroidales bacterium]|jgi:HAD superfamily hydrolase (TIGR01549 family)|nr:HAD family hydrolase [Bacteroidales bacterium]MCI2121258.1 HAD family hydrolase [Bacteroidales bacterium]MCI2146146.1 HAD family hydrolase [Bacteroidales bacterium]
MERKYKNILLDIDGTLIDTEKTAMTSLQETVRELLGKEMPLDKLRYYFGIPSRDTINILGFPDKEAAAELWESNYKRLHNLSAPFPGLDMALERFRKEGFELGVISSRRRAENEFDTHFHAIKHFFGCVICAEDSLEHKPKAGPVLAYMKITGAVPDECVYVGDAIADSLCAKAAGVDFILMSWRGEIPEGAEYEALARNFDELNDYICQRNK